MEPGFVSLDHVFAATLYWSENTPDQRFWLPSKYDESAAPVIQSNMFTKRKGVREALRCRACETVVVSGRDAK
jgi:hypothetical protein